ncbi:MAG: ABC-2 family transporter protein [Alphaproteobacteria bacterium]|nr:ABC-2 family transporter protein [Alphaproteobacteria bacterium]
MAVSNLNLFWSIQRNNFKSAFASKSDAFMNFFLMLLNNLLFVFMWWALLENRGSINGWTMQHLYLMHGINNFGFGIYAVFFRGCEAIPQYIENGSLENYITSPRNSLFLVLTSESTFANWGDIATGIILFICSGYYTDLQNIFTFLVLTMIVSVIFVAFRLALSTLSFYKNDIDRFGHNIFMSFLIFSSQPASVFGGWYKVIYLTIIPAGFISLFPVEIITDFKWVNLAILLSFTTALSSFAIWFFYRGLKRYSSGNKFGVR